MKDTDRLTAEEFAEYAVEYSGASTRSWTECIASRDAYRERKALEVAVTRAMEVALIGDMPHAKVMLRAAILGEPTFVKGQLVRWKSGSLGTWSGLRCADYAEPVQVRIDSEGRVIVDDEGWTP